MRRVMTFSFKVSLFSFNRLSSKIDFFDWQPIWARLFSLLTLRYLRLWSTYVKPCNRICRGNIHVDTMSTRVIYNELQIIWRCGGGTFEPYHAFLLNVTLSFFVTDKSSVWYGSFWPIPRSPIKRNSIFLCIRALFSYPTLCDVFRIGVLGHKTVLAHIAYGNIHTALFDFQGT